MPVPSGPQTPADPALGGLLARWHQWRGQYALARSYRGYRVRGVYGADSEESEEALERLTMRAVEAEIADMPRDMQLALQHAARAQALGVMVFASPALPANPEQRSALVTKSLAELQRRLLRAGVL